MSEVNNRLNRWMSKDEYKKFIRDCFIFGLDIKARNRLDDAGRWIKCDYSDNWEDYDYSVFGLDRREKVLSINPPTLLFIMNISDDATNDVIDYFSPKPDSVNRYIYHYYAIGVDRKGLLVSNFDGIITVSEQVTSDANYDSLVKLVTKGAKTSLKLHIRSLSFLGMENE